jgi:hypothetical protein
LSFLFAGLIGAFHGGFSLKKFRCGSIEDWIKKVSVKKKLIDAPIFKADNAVGKGDDPGVVGNDDQGLFFSRDDLLQVVA